MLQLHNYCMYNSTCSRSTICSDSITFQPTWVLGKSLENLLKTLTLLIIGNVNTVLAKGSVVFVQFSMTHDVKWDDFRSCIKS